MSRICALPLMFRYYMVKNVRINSLQLPSYNRNLCYSSRSTSNITSNPQAEFHNRTVSGISLYGNRSQRNFNVPAINYNSWRDYSGKPPFSSSEVNDDDLYQDDDLDWYSDDQTDDENLKKSVPSTIPDVPEYFPRVPMIATSFPIFPKFMKVFEITDPKLIKLLDWRLQMSQPYVGVFVRKDQKITSNVSEVKDVNECYPIGTFVKITEVHRKDGKLQFVATAHRRIQLEKQLKHERTANPAPDKKKRKLLQEVQSILQEPDANVYMVQVDNVKEEQPDLDSAEYKATTMEIVKTIRDIIMANSLIRDNLQQLLGNNLRVNDNPSYLADLAASITSSKVDELQEILEEMDVFKRLKMALNLLMKEKQLLELQQQIGKDVESKIKEQHRVFMLREQLKAIKRELGLEKDDKDALSEKYLKLLEGKVVPDVVRTVVDEELQKLSFLDNNSAEFNLTRNYLEWLTCLPWVSNSTNYFLHKHSFPLQIQIHC